MIQNGVYACAQNPSLCRWPQFSDETASLRRSGCPSVAKAELRAGRQRGQRASVHVTPRETDTADALDGHLSADTTNLQKIKPSRVVIRDQIARISSVVKGRLTISATSQSFQWTWRLPSGLRSTRLTGPKLSHHLTMLSHRFFTSFSRR